MRLTPGMVNATGSRQIHVTEAIVRHQPFDRLSVSQGESLLVDSIVDMVSAAVCRGVGGV